jgi:hypothetical protein
VGFEATGSLERLPIEIPSEASRYLTTQEKLGGLLRGIGAQSFARIAASQICVLADLVRRPRFGGEPSRWPP